MSQTRIKICGITNVETAEAAIDAGADAIGLVFADKSPRRIDIDTAFDIADVVPPFVTVVGLFQLASANDPDLEEWWGEYVQLHGKEDESLVEKVATSHKVIRGFKFDPKEVRRWDVSDEVEALLIDGSPGGRGEGFDHSKLAEMRHDISKPIILAGGLNAGNVGEAIRAVQPWAVDVSSGVEIEPGVKHPKLIRAFCEAVRRADSEPRP